MNRLALEAVAIVGGSFVIALTMIFGAGIGKPPARVVAVVTPTAMPTPVVVAAPPTPAPLPTTAPTAVPPPQTTAVPKPTSVADGRSPEELLAIIEHGAIRPNDPRVRPFAEQLDRMERKCSEDRKKLADLTTGANQVMEKNGLREPLLDTARGVATASEGLPKKQECADTVVVAYVALRLQGVPGTRGR